MPIEVWVPLAHVIIYTFAQSSKLFRILKDCIGDLALNASGSMLERAFVIDETMIQIGNDVEWLWIAIEFINRSVLGAYISTDRTMLIAVVFEKFGRGLRLW